MGDSHEIFVEASLFKHFMFKIFETMSFLGINSEAWDVYWQFNTFWNIFSKTQPLNTKSVWSRQ